MPELKLIRNENGFICIWKIEEGLEFFENCVNQYVSTEIKKKFGDEKRYLQKLVPHFLMIRYADGVKFNNLERKPFCDKGKVSISHCKNYVSIYFDLKNYVGIDIENKSDKVMKIRHKFMNETELNYSEKESIVSLFIWSIKEALFKKYGGDTAFFINAFSVSPFNFQDKIFLAKAQVKTNNHVYAEKLFCEIFDEFILVYTL